jgi:hypothetical protein
VPALSGVMGRAYRRLGPAPPCTSRERRWLLVIVLVATALRLAWVLYAAREPRGLHDPSLYEVYAARIADGHGYTAADGQATTYYPVGYVGALSAVVWLVRLAPFIGRRRPWRLFFLLAALALAVQPLIFFGDPRFHVPVLPFVAVLVAVTLVRARDRLAATLSS